MTGTTTADEAEAARLDTLTHAITRHRRRPEWTTARTIHTLRAAGHRVPTRGAARRLLELLTTRGLLTRYEQDGYRHYLRKQH